ncbi:MAG: sugar ABC transporter substrate-binding protein [Betaproteobacteria bacterium]|nr:sugar ABC transporter substrate-binding protein [Betaproteobacteria bacterium]MDH3437809.1 sugar ABC transporter substrate-binding protein [Betaproteobacteria bacterium]
MTAFQRAGHERPIIGVFTKNRMNPAYAAARAGAERTAARCGAQVVHYVPDKPDDIEEQIALVDRAIAERPDAVVFVPVHDTAMNVSVKKLGAARIPIVNYLNRLDEGDFIAFIGSDDYRLGCDIAEYLFRHIDGRGDLVIIEGVAGAVTNRERMRGFHDTLRHWPDVRVVASRPGNYQREPVLQFMRELLPALPRIDAVLAANDLMALAAIEALEIAGRCASVVGVNAVPEAITAIKDRKLLATADFDAMKIACVATEAALRHLRGERVPREILLPVQIVDASNCAAWDLPFAERPCPEWENVTY